MKKKLNTGLFKKDTLKKTALLLMIIMTARLFMGCSHSEAEETQQVTVTEEQTQEETKYEMEQVTINFWYCDDDFTPYLEQCVADYEAANQNVDVNLVLASESDYIDNLAAQAIAADSEVDAFLIESDHLEEARLAGIADNNTMGDIYSSFNYSKKALYSCTYNKQLIAYPLAFNTTFVVYNKDLIDGSDIGSFDDIYEYSNNIELPQDVAIKSIFTCDPKQIFFNYGFLGGVINVGGVNGDDKTKLFEVTGELEKAISLYKTLLASFVIDYDEATYYTCLNDFESSATLFTIADIYMLKQISDDNIINYGVLPLLDYNDEVATSPLSVTTTAVLNPFGNNKVITESFLKYITYTNVGELYDLTGRVSCRNIYENDEILGNVYESYDKSTPKLKLMYNEEFYALLEVAMHQMAKGDDYTAALDAVEAYMNEDQGDKLQQYLDIESDETEQTNQSDN